MYMYIYIDLIYHFIVALDVQIRQVKGVLIQSFTLCKLRIDLMWNS